MVLNNLNKYLQANSLETFPPEKWLLLYKCGFSPGKLAEQPLGKMTVPLEKKKTLATSMPQKLAETLVDSLRCSCYQIRCELSREHM
jgi:hypothetical protein